jgi:pimeloyl-ACP methyl ester carboxylesterase
MNSETGPSLEADLKPNSPFCGFVGRCKFDLHYFFGRDYANDPKRKNVLYISGGPGDIVDRVNANLDFMRIRANFIYFDVRGTGYSVIPESNVYDQFLRAQYVVEDIEALRKKILNVCVEGETTAEPECKPEPAAWDAIYAHSWGTIVAQIYARQYPEHVKKLILSAPVARAHGDTELARRTKIIDNLIDIFERQRPESGCDPKLGAITEINPGAGPGTATFCFLEEDQRRDIRIELTTLLNDIGQDYGSTAFVDSFYSYLKADKDFTEKYQYPREFFRALRQLEWLGAGEKEGMRFESTVIQKKIDAAFFVGYYLMLKYKPVLTGSEDFSCDNDAEFLLRLKTPTLKRNFCKRIEGAWRDLRNDRSNDGSLRARSVFGLYDGLTRWTFEMLYKERRLDGDGCFTGGVLQDVASGYVLKDKPAMREQARKLATSRFERICPWDPKRFRHDVDTLIFTGDADPITAGGQAEYLFEMGLTPGKRVLIEFPGAGHLMSLQAKVETTSADEFPNLVQRFLTRSVDQFIQDEIVIDSKCALGAKLFPPKPERKQLQEKLVDFGASDDITTNQNNAEAKQGTLNRRAEC